MSSTAYPAGKVQYVATARDGQVVVLQPAAWKWNSSDTSVAVVSSTGWQRAALWTGNYYGHGIPSVATVIFEAVGNPATTV